MSKPDRIAFKHGHIHQMIDGLRNNRKVVVRVGGHTIETLDEEIAFQQVRADGLAWAATATDAQIGARIRDLEKTLKPDELACKYGVMRSLPLATVLAIAQIEDLEIALGTHPALGA